MTTVRDEYRIDFGAVAQEFARLADAWGEAAGNRQRDAEERMRQDGIDPHAPAMRAPITPEVEQRIREECGLPPLLSYDSDTGFVTCTSCGESWSCDIGHPVHAHTCPETPQQARPLPPVVIRINAPTLNEKQAADLMRKAGHFVTLGCAHRPDTWRPIPGKREAWTCACGVTRSAEDAAKAGVVQPWWRGSRGPVRADVAALALVMMPQTPGYILAREERGTWHESRRTVDAARVATECLADHGAVPRELEARRLARVREIELEEV